MHLLATHLLLPSFHSPPSQRRATTARNNQLPAASPLPKAAALRTASSNKRPPTLACSAFEVGLRLPRDVCAVPLCCSLRSPTRRALFLLRGQAGGGSRVRERARRGGQAKRSGAQSKQAHAWVRRAAALEMMTVGAADWWWRDADALGVRFGRAGASSREGLRSKPSVYVVVRYVGSWALWAVS